MLFPLFFSGMLYYVARALAERSAPGRWPIGLLLAASAPLVVHHGTIAYMDLPLAFYLLGSVVYLARWEADGRRSPLLVAALFAGFLPQIKNEGFPFYLLLTLVVLFLARRATRPVRELRVWFAASLPLSLPWLLFKYAGGVPDSPYHLIAFGGIGPAAGRFLTFLRLTLENMFLTGSWGIAWFPLLFLFLPRRGRPVTVYTIVLASGFLLFAAAYSFTGSYAFLMNGTSLGRNLVVLLPLAIVAGVGSLTGEKADRPGGPGAGRAERAR